MKHHSQLKEIIQATYQQLDEKLDKRRIDFMSWLIIALCMSKTVNFLSLAEKIDRKGKISSHYNRMFTRRQRIYRQRLDRIFTR